MKVLMISGDKNATVRGTNANVRLELQKSAVEEIAVVLWGRGSIWPHIPQGHFDVVTVQDPFWRGLFGWMVARRIGARFNVQVHTDLAAQSFVRRHIAHFVLHRASSIRAVSERIKRVLIEGGVRVPITVLPVYIDVSAFTSLARHIHSGKHILWIGRMEKEKNPHAAIEIFKAVRNQIADTRLTMIGDGNLLRDVMHAAHGLPIELPGRSDPRRYFETADVVLSTSHYEGYGASIVEALAAGCPVVAPDVGIAKEAGARVVSREELAAEVVRALTEGISGTLNPRFVISKEEWVRQWRASLE